MMLAEVIRLVIFESYDSVLCASADPVSGQFEQLLILLNLSVRISL
jgi:hypothetical protein